MRAFSFLIGLIGFLILIEPEPLLAGPVTVKFSHVVAVDTPKGQAAELFKQRVEERSKGEIRVEIFPNASLYDDREAVEALSVNALQMAAPSFSKFTNFVPQLQLFDLPFLFDNSDHLNRILEGDVGKKLLKMAGKRGLVGLAYWDNGFKQISANSPLIAPRDANGLKFRIMPSKVLEEQFKTIGAVPKVLAFSDVYGALQAGLVDGQENTLSNIYTKEFYRVQSDLTLSNHGYLGYLVVTNRIFWEKLSQNQREIIAESLEEATEFARAKAADLNASNLAKIRESGKIQVHELTTEQRKVWKNRLMSIYPEFYDVIGKDLIESALAAGDSTI